MNPLFLDSTKPIGDQCVTNIEVMHSKLNSEESLYLETTDSHGVVTKYLMHSVETKKSKKLTTEFWSKSQQKFKYRFLIYNEHGVVQESPFYDGLTGITIAKDWQFAFPINNGNDDSRPFSIAPSTPSSSASPSPKKPKSHRSPAQAASTKNLPRLEPQFFQKMKNLLADLNEDAPQELEKNFLLNRKDQ